MFNLLSGPTKTIADKPKKKKPIIPGRIKKISYRGNVYGSLSTRGEFLKPEYDLGEISKVMDIEAYMRQAFNKHIEQCLKEGYQIKSRNIEATQYIKRRLREIGEASGRNFDSLLRGIITTLIQYSNTFVVKARDINASSGEMRKLPSGQPIEPVAAYFVLDPTSMEINRNIHGKVKKYKQAIPGVGKAPEFKPEDMIHMFYDRKEGFAFGTPYVVPVIDDIRTLRRMEENIEMLLTTHLYPLYQYIVGTEEHPAEIYEDGTTEVDIIKEEIENMPTEGSIVTPERHVIKVLGAEGKALVADPYLKHFELRVLAGLGISEIALGRGGTANRATASTIDKCMQDRCKDFQDVVENFINEGMMKELLLEGGFTLDDSEDNMVKLQFNEIDIENQIKMENHSVFKYESDVITEAEVREAIGKDPITDEQRNDMYFEHVTKPKAIIMAVDEPFTAEAKKVSAAAGGGVTAVKVNKEEKKKKETKEREQPSNQHGRKLVKTKVKKDELLKDSLDDIRSALGEDVSSEVLHSDTVDIDNNNVKVDYNDVLIKKLIMDIKKHWNLTRDDVSSYIKETYIEENRNFRDFTPDKLKMILFITKDSVVKNSATYVFQALKDGIAEAARESGRDKIELSVDPSVKYQYLEERVDYYTKGLLSDLGAQLIRCINPEFSDGKELKEIRKNVVPTIMGVFDALEYRIKFTAHTEVMKAYNFGYALAMRDLGYNKLYIRLDDNHCKICKEASEKPLSLEYFSFEDVAPVHPMCRCTYTIRND